MFSHIILTATLIVPKRQAALIKVIFPKVSVIKVRLIYQLGQAGAVCCPKCWAVGGGNCIFALVL